MIESQRKEGTFPNSYDQTPCYTVKQVADMVELSTYTVRYYENAGLIPGVDRSGSNARLFSEYNLNWLRLVHCLRMTGLPIEGVKRYINLCLEGDSTIMERAEIISRQEKNLRTQIRMLNKQMEVLKYKKRYYKELLESRENDVCNPLNHIPQEEPHIKQND